MRYCKVCLSNDLRPNASFNGDGVCIVCQHANFGVSTSANQQLRLEQLYAWIKELKARSGRKKFHPIYDCVVGVSGGKDSTRQAHWVRDKLGLNPLLVCSAYPPSQMTQIGGNNLDNLISMGFDLEIVCPAPQSSAALSLRSLKQFGNVCKSTEMALFANVPRVAIEKKIPFIFWGENPATQVGDSAAMGESVFDGNKLREVNTLRDGGYKWIESYVTEQKSKFYVYPSEEAMKERGVSIIYLGPAWDDWSEDENATYASLSGLELRPFDESDTGDITGACMLDEEFTNINMMIKYYKFGFGRTTDTVNEQIQLGILSRDDAIKLVEKYDGVCSDRIIHRYCDYVGIEPNEFWQIVNRFVNLSLFEIGSGSDRPRRKFTVGVDYDQYC